MIGEVSCEHVSSEAERLVKITRTTKDGVRLRRAGIVLASVQGRSASEAAAMFAASPQHVREVIHAFNTQGFAAQDPKWSGGRPPKFGPVVRELICRVAKTPPNRLGRPFTTWSLSKLAEYLTAHHRVVIGAESVRQILRRAGISWQATKTWKASGESGHPGWPDSWPQRALMMTPTLNYKELVNDAQSPCLLRSTPIKVFEVMDELLKPQ